LSLTY